MDDGAVAPDRDSRDAQDARDILPAEPRAAGARAPAAVRRLTTAARRLTAEHLLAAALGLLVLVVHDVGYLLKAPFWTDEAWVAVTTRFPLSQLPATTDSTPIGWSALLRAVTVAGTQISRLLPLAFAGVAVVVAYWFARRIGWGRPEVAVAAGLTAGAGVLLAPAMLGRDDLKQYTADACLALVVLALTSRLEREWSRRGLLALSVASWGGMLFSHTAAFAGTAAFVAVLVTQLARWDWRRLAEAAAVGAGTAVLMACVYAAFDRRAVTPVLIAGKAFSPDYFSLSHGLHAAATFVLSRVAAAGAYLGLGPAWLAVPLVVAGLVTMARLGRPATAVAVAVLWPEMLALSAVHRYPFLQARTSTFFFAVTVVVAAIGLIGICSLLRTWLQGAVAAGLAAAAVVAFAVGAQSYVRSHPIPKEDVRDQARYVAAHAARGDVILVNLSSNWGFAYYWPKGHPSRRPDAIVAQGYEAYFPGQPDIVVARARDLAGVSAALSQALARAGSCNTIWLVRTHVSAAERRAWRTALGRDALTAVPGRDGGLSVIRPGGSGCR